MAGAACIQTTVDSLPALPGTPKASLDAICVVALFESTLKLRQLSVWKSARILALRMLERNLAGSIWIALEPVTDLSATRLEFANSVTAPLHGSAWLRPVAMQSRECLGSG